MRGATRGVAAESLRKRYFNPRSSCEERLDASLDGFIIFEFQSTLLMRGATTPAVIDSQMDVFQSTLLMRGATDSLLLPASHSRFQSTLLMRGATQAVLSRLLEVRISIHAPHARSDQVRPASLYHVDISIHAPHARSDVLNGNGRAIAIQFQSTLLMRGATLLCQK